MPSLQAASVIPFGQYHLAPINREDPGRFDFRNRRHPHREPLQTLRLGDHEWSQAFLRVLEHPLCPDHLRLEPWTLPAAGQNERARRELEELYGPFPDEPPSTLFQREEKLLLGGYVFHASHAQTVPRVYDGYRLLQATDGRADRPAIAVTIPFMAELAARWLSDSRMMPTAYWRPFLFCRPDRDFEEGDLAPEVPISRVGYKRWGPNGTSVRVAASGLTMPPAATPPAHGDSKVLSAGLLPVLACRAEMTVAASPESEHLAALMELIAELITLTREKPEALPEVIGLSLMHMSGPLESIVQYCRQLGVEPGSLLKERQRALREGETRLAEDRTQLDTDRRELLGSLERRETDLAEAQAALKRDRKALNDSLSGRESALVTARETFELDVKRIIAESEGPLLDLRTRVRAEAEELDRQRLMLQPDLERLGTLRTDAARDLESAVAERDLAGQLTEELDRRTTAADEREKQLDRRERDLAAVRQLFESGMFDKIVSAVRASSSDRKKN